MSHTKNTGVIVWLIIYFNTFIWSAIEPMDYLTWFLEVLPAIIALFALAYTYHPFRLTTLSYVLILFHCVILMIGAHYTYAEVPLFDSIAHLLDLKRNNYDKLGHLTQGFVPAIIARELLIRLSVFKNQQWMNFFILSFCLGFSAFYELIEWAVALISGEAADAFLGTQGNNWDTQSYMAMALIGAIAALVSLKKIHDKQLNKLPRPVQ